MASSMACFRVTGSVYAAGRKSISSVYPTTLKLPICVLSSTLIAIVSSEYQLKKFTLL